MIDLVFLYLAGSFIFIILQGFFTANEIASVSSSLLKLRHRQESGDKKAALIYNRMMSPERFLATILVGTNISLVMSSSLLTSFLLHLKITNTSLWMMLFFSPFVVIFGELIPKNIGRHFRENLSINSIDSYKFFEKLFSPVVRIIELLTGFLVKSFIGKARRRSLFVTKEELASLIKEMEAEGGIDKGETEAIEEVFTFKQQKISDLYVDINKVVAIDHNAPYQNILEVIKQNGYTRYPVFKQAGEIAGYLNVFDLCYNDQTNWQALVRPIVKVDLNAKLYDVFSFMKEKKENLALVVSGNKTCGIVTFRDLIKEIITSIVKI